jgi:phage terminase large subunit GpA-like protein
VLEFEVPIPGSSETGGIKWQTDKTDRMIPGSVEYVCQSCGHGFKEKYKYEMNRAGVWIPDQPNPENPKLVSFQMSGLYSPPGMDGWETLAREYREAHPENQPIKESEAKAFYNTRMGLPFESVKEKLSATSIMQNQRQYSPGVVPERLSMADGNGRIVMLTCGADTGGKVEDGRLDYEVIAWSETGATYSVWHGSIGTFVSRENNLKEIEDREKWTYTSSPLNNIWKDFEEKVLSREFPIDGDDDNATMRIYATGIDYGAGTHRDYVIDFVDRTRYTVYGVKGNKEHRLIRLGVNTPLFEVSKAGNNRYLLQVNQYKDDVSDYMQLFWDRRSEQPANFMNYPQSEGGLYQLKGFFEHYEAEERKAVTKPNGDVEYRWTNDHFRQNHFWDCRIYNLGICDIIVYLTCKASKLNNPTYAQFVAIATA